MLKLLKEHSAVVVKKGFGKGRPLISLTYKDEVLWFKKCMWALRVEAFQIVVKKVFQLRKDF